MAEKIPSENLQKKYLLQQLRQSLDDIAPNGRIIVKHLLEWSDKNASLMEDLNRYGDFLARNQQQRVTNHITTLEAIDIIKDILLLANEINVDNVSWKAEIMGNRIGSARLKTLFNICRIILRDLEICKTDDIYKGEDN